MPLIAHGPRRFPTGDDPARPGPMSTPDEQVLIGVDGGGSGCRAAVGTAARGALGSAEAGPANIFLDFSGAIENVLRAVEDATARAGIDLGRAASVHAHLGLAGVLSPTDATRVRARFPFAAAVTDDRPTMLAGALHGDGYLVAIGTGSFVASQKGYDQSFVGGWGFHLGDEASGAWLGKRALSATLSACDGLVEQGALTTAILARFDGEPNHIVRFGSEATSAEHAELASLVLAAADEGDNVAGALMRDGARYMRAALAHLGYEPGAPLCLTGGLGEAYRRLLPADMVTTDAAGSALEGAFRLARRAAEAST